MRVLVNGDPRDISAPTLDAALSELGFGKSIVATALNGEFIAADTRSTTVLAEGDRVEIVAPMQGG